MMLKHGNFSNALFRHHYQCGTPVLSVRHGDVPPVVPAAGGGLGRQPSAVSPSRDSFQCSGGPHPGTDLQGSSKAWLFGPKQNIAESPTAHRVR